MTPFLVFVFWFLLGAVVALAFEAVAGVDHG